MAAATLMTARVVRPAPPSFAPLVSATLRDIHRHRMDEASRWLAPALAPSANSSDGWSAAPYIGDQFDRQYWRERALMAAIPPLLRPADAFLLHATTEALDRTCQDLDRLGRRQGMAAAVAAVSRQFLHMMAAERLEKNLEKDLGR